MIQEEIKRIGKLFKLNPRFKKNGELDKKSYKEFQDKVNWYYISWNQKLSEEFIEKFQDKVYWISISIRQKLSGEFIRRFYHKINFNRLLENKNISEEIKNKYNLIRNVIES